MKSFRILMASVAILLAALPEANAQLSLGRLGARAAQVATREAVNAGTRLVGNKNKSFTFKSLPKTLEELQALPEADLKDPYAVAALSVLALTNWEKNKDVAIEMLNWLKGPDDLSRSEISFIDERFEGHKYYKVFSYFDGAKPDNDYTPKQPYKIKASSNPYSFQNDHWATIYLTSGGADNPRPIRLREKPSTGQWFVVEIQYLSDIRIPASQDAWH